MNPKLFYTIKALDKFPSDLKLYIYNIIRKSAADLICEKLAKRYYDKVNNNCTIFMTFFKWNRSFIFDEDILNIKKFLIYAKNNITYNYIENYQMWINEVSDMFTTYSYSWNPTISFECLKIINNLLNKFETLNYDSQSYLTTS